MHIVFLRDNVHEMLKQTFWENYITKTRLYNFDPL